MKTNCCYQALEYTNLDLKMCSLLRPKKKDSIAVNHTDHNRFIIGHRPEPSFSSGLSQDSHGFYM